MKELIKWLLRPTGYTIARLEVEKDPQHTLPLTLKHFFDLYFSMIPPKDFFFVQIGANDGVSRDLMHDYIVNYKLSGILVEPQKDIFEKLKETYRAEPNLVFANVALSEKSGEQILYKVKKGLITKENFFETTAIASFDKGTFKKTLQKRIGRIIERTSENLEDYIEEEPVNALSFDDLVKQHDIKKIDLLFLDCEGYDHKIIRMIDFSRFSPQVIYYESKFLSDDDRSSCENLLRSKGYKIFRHGNDTCAFR